MPLRLRLSQTDRAPLELDGVLPERFHGQALAAIRAWPIQRGNRRVALGDCFEISGDGSDEILEIEGDLDHVHAIGWEMSRGEIRIQGRAGRRVGARMSGGRILASSDVGDGLGLSMSGGVIEVAGDAGDRVAAAAPGAKRGMTGGVITIGGSAGELAGLSMRRGLLAVVGDCGPGLGRGMIAGTIVAGGECGDHVGSEMRRGSIVLLDGRSPRLPLTFRPAGAFRPVILRLLVRELGRLGFPVDDGVRDAEFDLHHGDMLALGKGEVWIRRR